VYSPYLLFLLLLLLLGERIKHERVHEILFYPIDDPQYELVSYCVL
jgi:hypothetical protein